MRKLDRQMAAEQRSILLVMDNAPSHKISGIPTQDMDGFKTIQLDNVLILFLPANTTSVVQPLDAGIIAAFKMAYRKLFMMWQLRQLEKPDGAETRPTVLQVWHQQFHDHVM